MESFDAKTEIERLSEKLLSIPGRKVVAYSGGVDSTLVAYLCKINDPESVAVTLKGEAIPEREIENASKIAEILGLNHRIIEISQLKILGFIQNPPERCYYCKKRFINKLMMEFPGTAILDGTNKDDFSDIRPGIKALKDFGVVSILEDYTKEQIRQMAKEIGLPNWNRPSASCLATRIPFNQHISKDLLDKIDRAEKKIQELGFSIVRVRVSGMNARLEVGRDEVGKAFNLRNEITKILRKEGFERVSLDLEGYRNMI